MYCAKCGVELARGAAQCPLCGLKAFHPDIEEEPSAPPYPVHRETDSSFRRGALALILALAFAVPFLVCLVTDLRLSGGVTWSGYVTGGLLAGAAAVFPHVLKRRANPVVTLPIALAALLLLSLYICLRTGGRWFMLFAFPVGGAFILICECAVVLFRYTVRGRPYRILFILGGLCIAVGGLCVLTEFLIHIAFGAAMRWWSLYPLCALVLLGIALIIAGICRPIRTALHKKLFI